MNLFLRVFSLCVACTFFLLFCMNMCICRVSICFNFIYSSKFLCGIAQLDVGDATDHELKTQGLLRFDVHNSKAYAY
jgi:hypothetical protein